MVSSHTDSNAGSVVASWFPRDAPVTTWTPTGELADKDENAVKKWKVTILVVKSKSDITLLEERGMMTLVD